MDPNKMPVRVLIPILVLAYPLPVMGVARFGTNIYISAGSKGLLLEGTSCWRTMKSAQLRNKFTSWTRQKRHSSLTGGLWAIPGNKKEHPTAQTARMQKVWQKLAFWLQKLVPHHHGAQPPVMIGTWLPEPSIKQKTKKAQPWNLP